MGLSSLAWGDGPACQRVARESPVSLHTPLYERHQRLGAQFVDFAGWSLPLHYGSQIEEHLAVRRDAGIFDTSHMGIIDVSGPGAHAALRYLLANDVATLSQPGKALYSCLLNEAAGVLDDLIVYYLSADRYRLVVNASQAAADEQWLREHARGSAIEIVRCHDLAMLAVQGPQACAQVAARLSREEREAVLRAPGFTVVTLRRGQQEWLVARTGYTGEDGLELIVPADGVATLWDEIVDAGIRPCGLGARDTLRLEAGLNLYGNDMDALTTPAECGLAWTVSLGQERDFIGRAALESQSRAAPSGRQVGLSLDARGVLRAHQPVDCGAAGTGQITSGSYSPTLQRSIAIARVPIACPDVVKVEVRGKPLRARVVRLPFVRRGKTLVTV